mgnify:CR=1 FL=1
MSQANFGGPERMRSNFKRLTQKFIYQNDAELLFNPYKKSQDYYILQAVFATIFSLLTGGVFLAGFAIYLGASDGVVSYLNLIPSICGIFLVIGGIFMENVHSKKKTVIAMCILSKLLICLVVTIPLFVPDGCRQQVLLAVLAVAYILQALYGLIINKWFISVVPVNIRGRYFAVRQSFAISVNVVFPLITGWFMDTIQDKYLGFAVLYSLGLAAMAVEVFAFGNIDEPEVESMERKKIKLIDIIRLPLQNREFCSYTLTLFIFYIFLYFSSSFTNVYFIRYLKLPYTVINLISIFSAVLQIFMLRVWGRLSDKFGHQFVMNLCIWFFAGETLIWSIATKSSIIALIPFACIFSAAGNSGFAIGAFNRRYMIIPEKGRMIYDGFYSAAIGIALLMAPVLGGSVKAMLASKPYIAGNIQFGEFRALYMMTSVGIIALQVFNLLHGRKKAVRGSKGLKLPG